MNKAKLKVYAPQARRDFIAAVTARANLLGLSLKDNKFEVAVSQLEGDITVITGQAWPAKVHSQRNDLIQRINKYGFSQTMEAIAYTWFNRFAALRYMELHGYLVHGHRALSSREGTQPDILTYAADLARNAVLDGGLPGLKPAQVIEMKLAGNRDSELYRILLVAQCNALSNVMPFLFERIDDITELLLPDNLLRTDSIIAKLVGEIDENDWKEVEVIGWLYQFYISEKNEEVIGKVVKSEDIPAATQLFTPKWIVQYMVQNSVGRLWLMANPASALKAQWPYYIEPVAQASEVQSKIDTLMQARIDEDAGSLNPETITLLDPACGSGHILVEAYEVLKEIYLERGYQPRSIPRLILEKNLFGLDIDDRAAQMAGFALLMKARADDRRLFDKPVNLNVLSMQESHGLDADNLAASLLTLTVSAGKLNSANASAMGFANNDLYESAQSEFNLVGSPSREVSNHPLRQAIAALVTIFARAKTFGSLIKIPPNLRNQLSAVAECLQLAMDSGDLYVKAAAQDLWPLVSQALILGKQFDAVVANPPYMGNKAICHELKIFLADTYPNFEKDLFSAFMARNAEFTKPGGFAGFMSSFVWMYISTYESVRNLIIDECTLESLIQLDYDAYEDAKAHLCTFVARNTPLAGFLGSFINLDGFKGAAAQSPKVLEAIRNPLVSWRFIAGSSQFARIPGKPIAFWVNDAVSKVFEKYRPLSEQCVSVKGLDTCDNAKFVRRWYEVSVTEVAFDVAAPYVDPGVRWYPYSKGGFYRKWYGNNEFVVDWHDNGKVLRTLRDESGKIKARPQSVEKYFREGINFSAITSSDFSCRFMQKSIFGGGGNAVFSNDIFATLGFLNSKLVSLMTKALNPTLNILVGDILRLPYKSNLRNIEEITANVKRLVEISALDWAQEETSWEFARPSWVPLAPSEKLMSETWAKWEEACNQRIATVASLEKRNNELFLSEYELETIISPDVEQKKIPFSRADREKDCERLISYVIGCVMGRYSLDSPGLVYANAENVGFDPNRYASFTADADGIVPLTNEHWFESDAADRVSDFLRHVWGSDSIAENITWLAGGLGVKAGETPDESIRRYLADNFFKDHLQTYKKRPIYWLFSSGKHGAFQALVYMHRYQEGTLARMRSEYVVPLSGKIQSRIEILQKDAEASGSAAVRNRLAKHVEKLKKKHVEILAFDEQLRHYADMRVKINLNDGIKANYSNFGEDLLANFRTVTGGNNDD